jgi:hypothetical protein
LDSAPLSLSFMILVALLYSALIMGALWANNRIQRENRWPIRLLRFFVGGYLLIIGMLSLDRYFADFSTVPPHITLAIVPSLFGMLFLAFHPLTLKWVREIPQRWLIGLQSFRIIIEIQLYFLYRNGLMPRLLTFEGRNFDILVGLTAPLVAWLVHRAHRKNEGAAGLVTAWNIFGLILLTNIVVHAILSMPTKFQVFLDPPGNIGMSLFPFIWLPSFVVPLAYFLHILSLRREWAFRSAGYKKRSDSALGNSAPIR